MVCCIGWRGDPARRRLQSSGRHVLMAQIVLDQVSKAYGSEPALRDLSLAFDDDVSTAIVGPSGSGKSTLLQLINGLVRPDHGTVAVFGKPIDYEHLPELRTQIGYAVQGTGLFPHLSVEENITLLARLGGWPRLRRQARAQELMKLVGLPPAFAGRYPQELSGGQQQRVGLCRAMMLRPRVLLLDEPFGSLDPITRREIHEEFLRLRQSEPCTVVLVTHDLSEALKLGQRVVLLHDGVIEQQGEPDDLARRPATSFVRTFFEAQLSA
jgi:osmoprotectant transport system ATP-binding protein